MRGRIWLVIGAALGVAVAAGHLPYLAGAGRALGNTVERLVLSGANRLIRDVARTGAPRRVVLGLGGIVAVILPGVAALLLVIAARGTLRIRSVIAVLIVGLGALSFFYQPHGKALGVLVLALAVAGMAVTVTGPLVAAPLALAAGLLGGEFLPTLLTSHPAVPQSSVDAVHLAIYNRPGHPRALEVALLVLAALPFAWATRLVFAR